MAQIGIAQAAEGSYKGYYYFFVEIQGQVLVFTQSGWVPLQGSLPIGTLCYKTEDRAKEEFNTLIEHFEKETGESIRSNVKIQQAQPFICMQCKNNIHFKDQLPCRNCMYYPTNSNRKKDCADSFSPRDKEG